MFEGVQVKWNDGQKDTIKDLKMEVVVDSGTTSLLLPKDIIAAFVKTLTPPLSFEPITSRYDIDCNAEGPATFDFVIGGVELKIPLKELISEYADCKCCLQLYDVKSRELDYAILGQSFMRHVVVRHDVDALSMSFKQRVY
ncbi:aspartic peptidase domain-containing protein [Massariosphaeria phaeospora]|uniref:Aspartic peptidase domain-containing protein n=1 Tax=Massariosphaeria phaeospora TaxID=100035 RepID=A0A7C8I3W8_9PLEO|nr:aspartic peptidase domain-containing protein [Massariosphaeria phaeospora]